MTSIDRLQLMGVVGGESCTIANRMAEDVSGTADGQPFTVAPNSSQDLPAGSYVWARSANNVGWTGFPCKAGQTSVADRVPHMGDGAGLPFQIR